MSSNPNLSTILAADNTGDGNESTITNSLLSVKLQASKFQQISKQDYGKLPLSIRSGISTAPPSVIHRSQCKGFENLSEKNVDSTLNTGSDKLNQRAPTPLKTGDKHNLNYYLYHGDKMAATNINENLVDHNENIDCPTTDDDEDDETEDSTEISNQKNSSSTIKNERPKPGRLDLRQFDNITSAIAKLNVQPQLKTQPHKTSSNLTTTSKTPSSSPWKSAKPIGKQPEPINRKPQGSNLDDSIASTTAATRRPLQNPRKNHGKPVAPPRLPGRLALSESTPSSSVVGACTSIVNTASLNNQYEHTESELGCEKSLATGHKRPTKGEKSEDNSTELSQPPIARRLLRNIRDYKVCELDSPCESENDSPITPIRTAPRVYPRAQDLFKEYELPSPFITIGSYQRTHSAEPSELISTRGETIRQLNEILAKKPMGRPGAGTKAGRASSIDNQQQNQDLSALNCSSKKSEKESKKDKKRDEKLEKRKLKEEERARRQEEERQRRQEKKLAAKKSKSTSNGENCVGDDGIPLFIKRCIEFIEAEGLDAEGIYRVPGNRAHVDTFVQKFKDDPQMSILQSDIPVNAVATALKDFLSKKLGPIIPPNMMDELTELSNISSKEQRAGAVRNLVGRLPQSNYNILKYVFSHFVKVSLNNTLNSMDSKNLAICWWPTLLPLQFNDMVIFEQMRPHLEQTVQTMIDQYEFIFDCHDTSMQQRPGQSEFVQPKSFINSASHSKYNH